MPVSGVWRVNFNLLSFVESSEWNWVSLYLNVGRIKGTKHETSSPSGLVRSTSGRVVTVEASAGDSIELKAEKMEGSYYFINFCVDYIAKM